MESRKAATGASLQFNLRQNRWIVVLYDKSNKTQYSSSDNADREVPWNESREMNGSSWQVNGGGRGTTLEFEGTRAPRFSAS